MPKPTIKKFIEEKLSVEKGQWKNVSGGDVSKSFRLTSGDNIYFVKINDHPNAIHMFSSEASGLRSIKSTGKIQTPKVYFFDRFNDFSFLVMDFIRIGRSSEESSAAFGRAMAEMHQIEQTLFGHPANNYIATIKQFNGLYDDWSTFYAEKRLLKLIRKAYDQKLLDSYPSEDIVHEVVSKMMPDYIFPSLLHGDLWNGNYLIDHQGNPVLIDPAIYYGHHEVDLSMTRLFGGFDDSFYQTYHEVIPKEPGYNERNDVYQLYYLLVHLLLFGTSYRSSVVRIMDRYFYKN